MSPDNWNELGHLNRKWIKRYKENKFLKERKKQQRRELIGYSIASLLCVLFGMVLYCIK